MDKILAQDLKSILQGANVPIQAAYVFGSVAKGTAKPNSDIDIAVWCLVFEFKRGRKSSRFSVILRYIVTMI